MYALPEDLSAVLASANQVAVSRITVLEPDLATVRRAFDLAGRVVTRASVTADLRRDVHRSASLELVNVDGALAPALEDDLFAAGSPVVIERGSLIEGVPVYVPLMAGFVTGCIASMSGTLSVTVEGYLRALSQEMGSALTLPAGTFLVDALHTLWDPVLPFATWAVADAALERALGVDIPVLVTDIRLDVGLRIADDLGVDVYDDRLGRIVVAPRPDRMTQAAARVMTEPLSLSRSVGRLPINAQPVEASSGTDEPIYVLVEVDDPASPIHRDRIGLRMAPIIRSDVPPDPDTARAMGRAALAERAMALDVLTVSNVPRHLDLDEGDVVERTEAVTGTTGRWVLDTITVPLGPGSIDTSELSIVSLFLGDQA